MQQYSSQHHWTLETELSVQYAILESKNLLFVENGDLLFAGVPRAVPPPKRRLIIMDENAHALYGKDVRAYFEAHGVEQRILSLPTTEQRKDIDLVLEIVRELNAFGVPRRAEPIIGIGGGVILDIAGLAACLYRRGIPYVRVPTTLLALVDVSVAAKTGINFDGYRNRIGSYYPPSVTYLDKSFLRTLPTRQIVNGMGEILKLAVIKDRPLFELLERHGGELVNEKFQEDGVSDVVIQRAIQGMVEELEPNLWEKKLDRLVDFGHSFSPLVEMRALPELLHGEAVTLDVVFSSVIAFHRGLLSNVDLGRVIRTAERLMLSPTHPLFSDPALLQEALQDTMRHRDGLQRLPLPEGIGSAVFANDLTVAEIEAAAEAMRDLPRAYGRKMTHIGSSRTESPSD